MRKVNVGMIGSGYAAALHAEAYRKVYGVEVCLHSVSSVDQNVHAFSEKYRIGNVGADCKEMLADPEIDVIDICTPPFLHAGMIMDSIRAGKHVICEKPLTGFFGQADCGEDVGRTVGKREMLSHVRKTVASVKEVLSKSDRLFLYAENFIYAPAVEKSAELLQATGAKVLYLRGEESHSGSHAAHAAQWRFSGGGSLIRLGTHPLSAILYLKQVEAARRGESIGIRSVLGDMGVTTDALGQGEKDHIDARPVDVEDCAHVILTFTDGTKACIVANDMVVGGVRNQLEVFTHSGVHLCRISPNDGMTVYHADGSGLEQVYLMEKAGSPCGWNSVSLQEELARGYVGEMQDFMECVLTGRQPKSGFQLACDTALAIYAAYVSAEEGIRFDL